MIFNKTTIPNLACSAWNALVYLFTRRSILALPATVHARLLKCAACPELDVATMQCKACTCFVRAKVYLVSEKCPKGLWPKEKITYYKYIPAVKK